MNYRVHFILLSLLFFFSCQYPKTNYEYFSDQFDILIPEDVKVDRDLHTDTSTDVIRDYFLSMEKSASDMLAQSIRSSIYFNPAAYMSDYISPEVYMIKADTNGICLGSDTGYACYKTTGQKSIIAQIDTIHLVALFRETKLSTSM